MRAAEADDRYLMRRQGELFPLYAAAHEIISGFRQVQEPEPKNERAYVNCLLTTLARGNAQSVTLAEGTPLPDPADLTADAEDLKWIAGIGFALDRLSTHEIIGVILEEAGFRWFHVGKAEGRIAVKLVVHGGGSFSDAVFRVLRRRSKGRIAVEIRPVRAGPSAD